MIEDLRGRGADASIDADVVVVGGGIAGLIAATELADAGNHVVVLESGDRTQQGDTHPLNDVELSGGLYRGAAEGRFRCLGGTSTRWGGALIPFAAQDCAHLKQGWDGDWLGIHPELMTQLARAERLFGLPAGGYDGCGFAPLDLQGVEAFSPRLAKWPGFRRRNVATLLAQKLDPAHGPHILLNATVDGFEFAPSGELAALRARAPDNRAVRVRARRFVIAAGAIESTRLLLLADRAADNRIFAPHDVLGRYFSDHVSLDVGEILPRDRRRLNMYAGFRFEKGGMRNLRFETAEALRRAQDLPAAFAHIAFDAPPGGGFDVLRLVLRRIQRRELPAPADLLLLARTMPYLAGVGWWRFAHRRLLYPGDARVTLHVVVEQEPLRRNRITLGERLDAHGNPLAHIDWMIGRADRDALVKTAELFCGAWRESNAALGEIRLKERHEVDNAFAGNGGIFHPSGSTRIGRSSVDGVLDRDLRAFGIPNLTVTATSAFPTGGGANPTMMLVLATLRAADRIAAELRR